MNIKPEPGEVPESGPPFPVGWERGEAPNVAARIIVNACPATPNLIYAPAT